MNDSAAGSLFQLCSFMDLELDFSFEVDVDDVAEFGGWREGIAVGGR